MIYSLSRLLVTTIPTFHPINEKLWIEMTTDKKANSIGQCLSATLSGVYTAAGQIRWLRDLVRTILVTILNEFRELIWVLMKKLFQGLRIIFQRFLFFANWHVHVIITCRNVKYEGEFVFHTGLKVVGFAQKLNITQDSIFLFIFISL